VDRIASIDDLRSIAQRKLPRVCFDWLDGGAYGETTLARNRQSLDELTLLPRYLVDVSKRDLSTVVCGTKLSMPVMLSPTGLNRIAHRDAERAVARAAGRAGTVFCISTASSIPLEEIARVATGPLWFQLYLWRSREVYEGIVRRACDAGYEALVVTVDVPLVGTRERDIRNGFTLPLKLSLRNRIEAARHPRWVWGYLRQPEITFGNLTDVGAGTSAGAISQLINSAFNDPSATYDNLRRLREMWPGKLLVKGTLTAEDAELAVAEGIDGIVVSNHGGRQLDHAPATIDVLPEIVAAVGNRVDVLVDSGFRRGSDIVKALALGAKAVMVGRPYLYGLAAAGEAGVTKALEILRVELDTCLGLIGRPSLADLDPSVIGQRRAAVGRTRD
jgi:isopentenyl diphosphate isomerase/L-lactate dehydrogenase-like FMN-dependent dehydrogenase